MTEVTKQAAGTLGDDSEGQVRKRERGCVCDERYKMACLAVEEKFCNSILNAEFITSSSKCSHMHVPDTPTRLCI